MGYIYIYIKYTHIHIGITGKLTRLMLKTLHGPKQLDVWELWCFSTLISCITLTTNSTEASSRKRDPCPKLPIQDVDRLGDE